MKFSFDMIMRIRKQKGIRISNYFALFLVLFKWYHDGDRVRLCFCFSNTCAFVKE